MKKLVVIVAIVGLVIGVTTQVSATGDYKKPCKEYSPQSERSGKKCYPPKEPCPYAEGFSKGDAKCVPPPTPQPTPQAVPQPAPPTVVTPEVQEQQPVYDSTPWTGKSVE